MLHPEENYVWQYAENGILPLHSEVFRGTVGDARAAVPLFHMNPNQMSIASVIHA